MNGFICIEAAKLWNNVIQVRKKVVIEISLPCHGSRLKTAGVS
jgi:hypothetical protein